MRRRIEDVIAVSIVAIATMFICRSCNAGENVAFSDQEGIYAVLGEAGQSYEERLAIAHAIRNRGTLKGVYGAIRKDYSAREWQLGSKAWFESEGSYDPTKGADHWLSDYDLKNCKEERMKWKDRMVKTAYIGSTHFYRNS